MKNFGLLQRMNYPPIVWLTQHVTGLRRNLLRRYCCAPPRRKGADTELVFPMKGRPKP